MPVGVQITIIICVTVIVLALIGYERGRKK